LRPKSAIDAVAELLDAAPSLADGLTAAAPVIDRLVPFDRLTLVLFEPDGEHMAVCWLAEDGMTTSLDEDRRQSVAMSGTPAEWVRASGQTLHERDTLESRFPHHPVRDAGRRSFILAPLGAPAVGVLGWSRRAPGGYPADEVAAAERIARLVAARLVA
jgi:hypothetical protein